ncbi:MAG: hypothetical protein QF473_19265, partial [Planctomycetota bacterium]|nr:hypothetical protein [Planctomycetota bacterium]
AGPRVLHRRTGRLCNGMAAMWNIAESFTGTTVAVPNFVVKRAFLSQLTGEFSVSFLDVKLKFIMTLGSE